MNPIFLEYPILFLQRAGSYDGDIEGGSISNLLDSAGRLLYVVVGIVVFFYIIRNLYEYFFIDLPIKREKEIKEYIDKKYPTFKPVDVVNNKPKYIDYSKSELKIMKFKGSRKSNLENLEDNYKKGCLPEEQYSSLKKLYLNCSDSCFEENNPDEHGENNRN